jgi:hypothetical protein
MARTKLRKNCGPQLVNRVKELTQDLYDECEEEARTNIDLTVEPSDVESTESWGDRYQAMRKLASDIYQERLKQLSTSDLEDILWVHENGLFRRARFTVENITLELATRQLLEPDDKNDD